MHKQTRARLLGSTLRGLMLLLSGVVLLASPGCYERTLEGHGIGASYGGGDYYEPSVKQKGESNRLNDYGSSRFGVGEKR